MSKPESKAIAIFKTRPENTITVIKHYNETEIVERVVSIGAFGINIPDDSLDQPIAALVKIQTDLKIQKMYEVNQ